MFVSRANAIQHQQSVKMSSLDSHQMRSSGSRETVGKFYVHMYFISFVSRSNTIANQIDYEKAL